MDSVDGSLIGRGGQPNVMSAKSAIGQQQAFEMANPFA
jgi:hypothetical protein